LFAIPPLEELPDIKEALKVFPIFEWMAEFNTYCLRKIMRSAISKASLATLSSLPKWMAAKDVIKPALEGKIDQVIVDNTEEGWKQDVGQLISA
jgi:hypothetical protein